MYLNQQEIFDDLLFIQTMCADLHEVLKTGEGNPRDYINQLATAFDMIEDLQADLKDHLK